MNKDERVAISRELCELFELANELRRRIDELAEIVAHPPAPAQVLQLHRKATFDPVIHELQDMSHLPKLGLHQDPE